MTTTLNPSARIRRRLAPPIVVATLAAALALGGSVAPASAAPGDQLVAAGTGVPTLNVSKTVNVAGGNSITISGSGYDATTIAPSTGQVAGFYVSIGSIDNSPSGDWRPSLNKPASSRLATQTIWVHPGGSGATEANLTSTGTFTKTVTVATQYTKPAGNTWAVFSIGANGLANSKQEQAREIGYTGATTAPPASGTTTPTLSVNRNSTGNFTVTGSGYSGVAATGIYASIGVIDTTGGWKPSAGKASSTRQASDTFWVHTAGPTTPASGQAKLTGGTFSVTLAYPATLPALPAGYSYAVYTVGAHGVVNAAAESAVVVAP